MPQYSRGLLYRDTLVPQGVPYEYVPLSTACIYVVGGPEAHVSCKRQQMALYDTNFKFIFYYLVTGVFSTSLISFFDFALDDLFFLSLSSLGFSFFFALLLLSTS